MKIAFYVFSGTGNTLRVCRYLEDRLKEEGNETEFFRIENNAAPVCECDCMIVGYPVHAFNAPTPVLKFLNSLHKNTQKTSVYFVQTSGEPLKLNNAACILPRRIAKRRGYRVMGMFSYVMPYNIIFRHSDGMAARMWNVVTVRAPQDAAAISSLQKNKCKINIFRRFVAFVLRIEHTAMPLIGRRFKPTDDCIGCGVCQEACPQNNIEMIEGKPKFGKHCVACMGCSFRCPKEAIKISLLNGWRVNGKYFFDGTPATDEEVCDYCRKAYLRYFHTYEDDGQQALAKEVVE